MSWFFGGSNNNNNNDDDNFDDQVNEDFDDEYVDSIKDKHVIADFDPKPLIEGAKALKQIDSSSNSKDVLRLALEQQKTKQAEARLRQHQLEAQNLQYREQIMKQQNEMEQKKQEMDQRNWQERMKQEMQQKERLEKQKIQEKQKAQAQWLKQQEDLNEKNLQRRKQVEDEIERKKRETMDYQAKLDRETNSMKVKAETEGKINIERANEEIHLRSQKSKLEEERKTRLDIRKEELIAYKELFSGIKELITDEQKLYLIGKTIIGITAGIFITKKSVNIIGKQIETNLGKPSLVRETSRWSWKDLVPNKNWFEYNKRLNKLTDNELKGIILQKDTENKIKFITRSIKKTKENKAPFRHLLIHGPPGTGKTLFAKTLSKDSGLDYAIITGADFSQLGNNAVNELHKIFDWASASNKGTILFIDEADAFLRKGRDKDIMSENMRNALSAFLYRTGTETTKFMIVLASNVPNALDKAVLDRVDDMIEFPLPAIQERITMLKYYFDVYITQKEEHALEGKVKGLPIKCVGFDEDEGIWQRIAEKMDGFSGRQIAKYMIRVQATIYGSNDIELTPFLMQQILETYLVSKSFGHEEDTKTRMAKHLD